METLELLILELDGVNLQGQSEVRSMRRAAVVEIQHLIQQLESRSLKPNSVAVSNSDSSTIGRQ